MFEWRSRKINKTKFWQYITSFLNKKICDELYSPIVPIIAIDESIVCALSYRRELMTLSMFNALLYMTVVLIFK